ncbi:hypothetical protein [uncultured Polaribacter sp.]|uniref:hypothetical protein n=1 Tax=uncultured Polaribacter sp. TaxID=174711 RepID=UPI0026132E14|nr:hypothetical protein [uncultured Polaribacter sp.]
MEIIISLLSGVLGGNLAGGLLKKYSMGTLWNSVVGILGGGVGSYLLGLLGANFGSGSMDLAGILGMVAEGGVGGGALMAIIGVIKGMMNK